MMQILAKLVNQKGFIVNRNILIMILTFGLGVKVTEVCFCEPV